MGSTSDPLALKEVAFKTGQTRLVKDGKVVNNAQTAVVSYQLAFAVVDRATWRVSIVPGPIINSTAPITPKEERGLIPIALEDFVGQTNFAAIGVFVHHATFADGTIWDADAAKVKADVEDATSEVQGSKKS